MSSPVNQAHPFAVDSRMHAPLGWLLSPRCVVCGDPGMPGRDLCAACHADLPWQTVACHRCALPLRAAGICAACLQQPPPLDAVHAAFGYAFPLDRLLPRLKFHRDFACGRVLAQCLIERFATQPRPQVLIPIPLHRRRLRQRGYDQARELAHPLARALGIPLLENVLQRSKATTAQSRLNAAARLHNLCGAFRVTTDTLPAQVVLFDDVMTTGATLHAAATALRQAGAARIEAWVCARVA